MDPRRSADDGEMHAHLSAIRTEMSAGFQRIERKQDLTNGRVMGLEKFRWLITGAVIVLSALVGYERVLIAVTGA